MKKNDIVPSEYIEDGLGQYDPASGEVKWVSPYVNIATVINDNGDTLEEILPTSSKEIQDEINRVLEEVPRAIQTLEYFREFLESNPDVLQVVANIEANKVDKIEGYGLSQKDFTADLKDKLDGIDEDANKTVIVNNLDEVTSGKALDAYQGYLLALAIAAIPTYGLATASDNGLMTSTDKVKMDNIEVSGIRVYASTDTIPTLPNGVIALIYEV